MTTPATPYRNEIETLEARKAVLENELESIHERIKERRKLPLLDQMKVAAPCSAKWDDMVGDERKRFCLNCDKDVFNVSALSREDAEAFLQDNAGGEVCVRYYQRADGTVMTSDCSVGVKRKARKKLAFGIAGAGAMALGAVTALSSYRESQVMGKMEMTGATSVPETPPPVSTTNEPGTWVAGGLRPIEPTPPPPPVKPPVQKMGRIRVQK